MNEKGATVAKRGSQACPYCGILNGNRAFNCKSCSRNLRLQEGAKKRPRSAVDVSDLYSPTELHPKPKRFYSVRVRNRGPDYRTFVSMHTSLEDMECHYEACTTARDARIRSSSIACGSRESATVSGPPCGHLAMVQKELETTDDESICLTLNETILHQLPFPSTTKEELVTLQQRHSTLIKRVSPETFLVRGEVSQQHQFGLLHVRLTKTANSSSKFYCPCSNFTRFPSQTAHSGGGTTPRLSKRCIHLYICLWAFASDKQLAAEFSMASLLSNEHEDTKGISAVLV